MPVAQLAQFYIEEGEAAQVRGDIAFAQSILETGSFSFPDGGQLTPTDNNFAGHGRLRQLRRTAARSRTRGRACGPSSSSCGSMRTRP